MLQTFPRAREAGQENQMKKFLFVAVGAATLGLSAPASSADLAARPYTKAPVMAAIYDWSGFYIGINGGGGSAGTCWDLLLPAAPGGARGSDRARLP